MADAFDGSIIDASVGDFDAVRKIFIGNRIAMVLARNIDPSGAEILDRMVGTSVSEGQLESMPAKSGGQHLDAQTNTENRADTDEFFTVSTT